MVRYYIKHKRSTRQA